MTPAAPPEPPPPDPAPVRPLSPPVTGQVMFFCSSCGQPRRFVQSHKPHLGGTWFACGKCGLWLGMYTVDERGMTWLRLVCV